MKRTTFTLDDDTKILIRLIAKQIAGNNASFVVRELVSEKAKSLGITIPAPAPQRKHRNARNTATLR